MKNVLQKWGYSLAGVAVGFLAVVATSRCGSDPVTGQNYSQIERLARPAINEGLVTTNDLLNLYNAVAPTVDLTTPAANVITNVAQVLTAIYAGVCFVSQFGGVTDGTAANAPKPGLIACPKVGNDVLVGTALDPAITTSAGLYVNQIAGWFLPDVMRIDTDLGDVSGTNKTGYFVDATNSLCGGGAAGKPLLCGGRRFGDNVGDATYLVLFATNFIPGVSTDANTALSTTFLQGTVPVGTTPATTAAFVQGHKSGESTFPYIPRPY